MSRKGEIIVVEDDMDDREFFSAIVRDLDVKNEIVWFDSTDQAYDYLMKTAKSIFIIFCDINVPGRNGLEFKKKIDSEPKLRKKSIPFIFYSTLASQREVNEAYTEMTVQGFFKKNIDFDDTKVMIKTIFDYWGMAKHPNTQ